jgi:3-oxoacyl-[acyl-carrier protein] reductase
MDTKLVLITGAGSGIGLHLAKTLQAKGCSLLLIDLNLSILQKHFTEDEKIQLFQADVSKAEVWKQIAHAMSLQKAQGSDLFNCVGVIRLGFIRDFDLADIDYHLDINTKGSILGIKTLADLMKIKDLVKSLRFCLWQDWRQFLD